MLKLETKFKFFFNQIDDFGGQNTEKKSKGKENLPRKKEEK